MSTIPPSPISQDDLLSLLKSIKYPGFSRDIVSFGLIRNLSISNSSVSLSINLNTRDHSIPAQLDHAIKSTLLADPRISSVDLSINVTTPPTPPPSPSSSSPLQNKPSSLQNVKHIIAISSGKGGVGKSTIAVNLACAFENILGHKSSVGLMDCDIYGPSTPLMLGIHEHPEVSDNSIYPVENFGIKAISMGLLIDENAPVVWRGPMVNKTIQQFTTHVLWGSLDILLIDLPPGTGDAHLTLAQSLPLSGAIVITTPQTAAVNVAKRGAKMFDKLNVPILGVIENMSYFLDPTSNHKHFLFGQQGGQLTANFLNAPLLAQIPIEPDLRLGSDHGLPLLISQPDHPTAAIFTSIAQNILSSLNNPKPPST